ncbi:efflux RND transporter periplasmic adaptor subunit [Vibrio genomosp. F10]|uniref:efflux RND transporter periplasmic adaptor subunit n=1 Tax=Vibrio genomosp. F10 TaxID=723171 RepID=UPI0002E95EF6|nr:efflux RND transporter periplasmic adaptor subunit [Vibrio genomosp. F10]OEF04811.1 efflux transporter periplasmic adaptor subunit [Vibrio genomosp. F10 str. 9ZD137]
MKEQHKKWTLPLLCIAAMGTTKDSFADDFPQTMSVAPLSCLLEPSSEVELSSEVQGVIKDIRVQRGDKVKEGEVVMTLRSSLETAAMNTVLARLEFANRKVQRNADLFKKNLISENEQDEMLTEQKLAAYQLKEARVRLELRETRSPISGVVVERIKDPGEFVDETPFLRLVTLNPIHAEVILPAELYGTVTKNESVSLVTLGSQQEHVGKVKIIDPIIDAASNTFAITIALDNKKGDLSAGLRCQVQFSESLHSQDK